jgi:hypothetical protein
MLDLMGGWQRVLLSMALWRLFGCLVVAEALGLGEIPAGRLRRVICIRCRTSRFWQSLGELIGRGRWRKVGRWKGRFQTLRSLFLFELKDTLFGATWLDMEILLFEYFEPFFLYTFLLLYDSRWAVNKSSIFQMQTHDLMEVWWPFPFDISIGYCEPPD